MTRKFLFGPPWISSTLPLLLASAALATADVVSALSAHNQSLLWGPYRPNLYFGVRPRIPDGILTALLWSNVEDYNKVQTNFRYTCEQNEGMTGYGWDKYDPRFGGIQTIHDAQNDIDMTTSFVKISDAGDRGGNWAVRVKGSPRPGARDDIKTTVVFSVTSPGSGLMGLEVAGDMDYLRDPRGIEGDITIKGDNPTLGPFKIVVTERSGKHPTHNHPSQDERPLDRSQVASATLPENVLWQTRPLLFNQMRGSIDAYLDKYGQEDMPPPYQFFTLRNNAGVGNQHFVQKVYEGGFEFDILFTSGASDEDMTSDQVTHRISSIVSSFDKKFEGVLKPQAPFTSSNYMEVSKALFSNLLGGIGYFYGDWRADRTYAPEYEEDNEGFWEDAAEAISKVVPQTEGPSELFTAIPSRTFFPRGFLWDEGFHLIPVMEWDVDLALDILMSWFKLIDDDGWIAREQILGEEARSKVPPEFQTQYPHYANPPTLFLIVTTYIDKLSDSKASESQKEAGRAYLQGLYPLIMRHYEWFRKTQQGDLKTYEREAFSRREGYRWRGRTPKHCLPSGLDDYPRAQPPHPGELHVDALSWVGLMARSLRKIAQFIGEEDDLAKLSKQEEAILRNLDDLHWDEKNGVYCDATIDQFEEAQHVCHKGYISLLPFMVGLMRHDDPKVGKLLELISNPDELWTEHGIRSLSKADELYGTEENYWRSPIWINMNYLLVERLLELAQAKGPHQARAKKIYTDLRANLVRTVAKSWEDTGFAWEQYNPETGAGQRTQHFTGWTSLAVKIMAMPSLEEGHVRDEL